MWPWPKFIAEMARDSVHNNINSLAINSCLDLSARTWAILWNCHSLSMQISFKRVLAFINTMSFHLGNEFEGEGVTALPLNVSLTSNESKETSANMPCGLKLLQMTVVHRLWRRKKKRTLVCSVENIDYCNIYWLNQIELNFYPLGSLRIAVCAYK